MGVRPGSLIVVLGGGGFLGRALLQELQRCGYRSRLVTRRPDRHRDLSVLPGLELWEGDVHDQHFLCAVMDGAQAVVNLVGTLREPRLGDFRRAHEELPERVGRLAEGMRLVHVSALGADIHGGSAYLRSKACGEQRLLARAPTATIVRPSVVYGPSDHFVSRFYRLARWAPWGVPVPLAESLLAPVHVADVVSGLMAILTRLEAQGELYEFCGPQVLSLGEIVTLITQASGHHARPWALSSRASWWLASLGDRLPFLPLTRDEWRTLNGSVVCSEGSMGLRELGVCPRAFTTALNGLLPPPRLVG